MKYDIYDGRNPRILDNNSCTVEASTARQALQRYLNKQGEEHIKFHNTSGNDVIWKTTPIVERDGKLYRAGRISWWGIPPVKLN